MADSVIRQLSENLRQAFIGPAWHGPSFMELVREVPVDLAPAKPLEHAHSIWEIALHVAAWNAAIADRLQGKTIELSAEEDWPAVRDYSEAAWAETIRTLEQSYQTLAATIGKLSDAQLSTKISNRNHDYLRTIQGIGEHCIYHAGQIAVLRKSSR